jgi:hypothetical protein
MKAHAHTETFAKLLEAAQQITQTLADDFKEDVETIRSGHGPDGIAIDRVADFTVGSMLPLEKAAQDLLALLAAARVLQGLK